jgi:cell division septum initiation protein DivIVA
MEAPPRTDPPYVPIRHTPWPKQKTPRWLMLAGLVVLLGAVLVGLAHRPSQAQRAGDLRGFLTDVNTDIESCAGGVRESLTALHEINAGEGKSTQNIQDTIQIAQYGASNCSPANNEQLDDLTQYQVTESLAGFHLGNAVNGLVTWAFPDAQRVQNDVAAVLSADGATARARANAALARDTRDLNAERAKVDKIMMNAVRATSAQAKLPDLPG